MYYHVTEDVIFHAAAKEFDIFLVKCRNFFVSMLSIECCFTFCDTTKNDPNYLNNLLHFKFSIGKFAVTDNGNGFYPIFAEI